MPDPYGPSLSMHYRILCYSSGETAAIGDQRIRRFRLTPAACGGNLKGTKSTMPAAKTHYPFGHCSPAWFLLHPVYMEQIRSFLADESGQDLIEYTLLMSFVAIASAGLFIGAGKNVKGIWVKTSMQLSAANAQV